MLISAAAACLLHVPCFFTGKVPQSLDWVTLQDGTPSGMALGAAHTEG